jgi:hypothetical protein
MSEDDQIEKMILDGSLEVSGIDEATGEFLYTFTEKLAEQYPELYKETQTYFSKEMMFLWENNFVAMDITESNPLVSLTEKALDKEQVSKLSPEVQAMLKEVVRVLYFDE